MILYHFKKIAAEKLVSANKRGVELAKTQAEIEKTKNKLLDSEEDRNEFLKDRKNNPFVQRRIRDSIVASTMYQ